MNGWLKFNLIVTLLLITPACGAAEGVDFGDYSSETLTTRAWQALNTGDYDLTLTFTSKCIQLYTKDAIKQQERLSNFAPKEEAFDHWALNDVGTCYFIMGEAYLAKKEWSKALKSYESCYGDFTYSQCYDPAGPWFWKPGVASRGKVNKIKAEHPDLLET